MGKEYPGYKKMLNADGKITLAVKSFVCQKGHRNKAAAPSGHLSVWMEAAKLSPVTIGMTKEALHPATQ